MAENALPGSMSQLLTRAVIICDMASKQNAYKYVLL